MKKKVATTMMTAVAVAVAVVALEGVGAIAEPLVMGVHVVINATIIVILHAQEHVLKPVRVPG